MNHLNVFNWLLRNADFIEVAENRNNTELVFYGEYMGHKIRYLHGVLDVGHKDFDRWANSVAVSTEIPGKNISKEINVAVTEARRQGDPGWYYTMRLIKKIFP